MHFVLTRDMCPIHYSVESGSYAHFVCPLPLGYRQVVKKAIPVLGEGVNRIVKSVNAAVLKCKPPFANILIEYRNRTEEEQQSLLQGFPIQYIGFNADRGLYGVSIHGAYGDIYLDENTRHSCDLAILPFSEFFEPNTAFHCHNVDYYWQALITREVAVEYFNLISSLKAKMKSEETTR